MVVICHRNAAVLFKICRQSTIRLQGYIISIPVIVEGNAIECNSACKLFLDKLHGVLFHFQVHCDQDDSSVFSLVTPSDLAFYVTLCALASFDRSEIKSRALSSPSFRLILESEGSCRDILQSFYQANYAGCFGALSTGRVRDILRLDLFLSNHVTDLMQKIRARALCQV